MLKILKSSLEDFFTFKILSLVCVPLILNLLLIGSVLYFCATPFYDFILSHTPQWIQDINTNTALWAKVVIFIYSLSVYLILGLGVALLALLCNLFFSLFYTPLIVRYVHNKDFSFIKLNPFGSMWGDTLSFTKDLCIFAALFILCIPLYFIPICGTFIPLILGFFFFKRRTFYDVGSYIMDKTQFDALQSHRFQNSICALLSFLFSLIPFVSFFLMPLQILIITRYILDKLHSHTI